ncbi:hypothetical protein D3C74_386340 [compost metagenome]
MQNLLDGQAALQGVVLEQIPGCVDTGRALHHAGAGVLQIGRCVLMRAKGEQIAVEIGIFPAAQLVTVCIQLDVLTIGVNDEGSVA